MNGQLVKVAAIGDPPLTVDDVKQHTVIDQDDQDTVIDRMLRAALEWIEDHTGRALSAASYQLRLPAWPTYCGPADWQRAEYNRLEIPLAPVRDVDAIAITYLDTDDAEQTVAADLYDVELTDEGATITFTSDFTWPALSRKPNPVRVNFDAGYDDPNQSGAGADPELLLPERLALAALMMAATFFDHRTEVTENEVYKNQLAAECLAGQLRIYR